MDYSAEAVALAKAVTEGRGVKAELEVKYCGYAVSYLLVLLVAVRSIPRPWPRWSAAILPLVRMNSPSGRPG